MKKINFENISVKLSRRELRNIMAGSNGDGDGSSSCNCSACEPTMIGCFKHVGSNYHSHCTVSHGPGVKCTYYVCSCTG